MQNAQLMTEHNAQFAVMQVTYARFMQTFSAASQRRMRRRAFSRPYASRYGFPLIGENSHAKRLQHGYA